MTTTTRIERSTRSHHLTSRKDLAMQHIELRLAAIIERQSLERSLRDADRVAWRRARPIRSQIGESLIRLGRRVAGEGVGSPALTG